MESAKKTAQQYLADMLQTSLARFVGAKNDPETHAALMKEIKEGLTGVVPRRGVPAYRLREVLGDDVLPDIPDPVLCIMDVDAVRGNDKGVVTVFVVFRPLEKGNDS